MRLVSIQLHGYKRFAERNTLNVDGPVVAIVGPNEAGKTSLLESLLHLNGSPVFDPSEFTRDQQPPKFDVVAARFLLESEDHARLAHLAGGDKVRWFIPGMSRQGSLVGEIQPLLRRDQRPRAKAVDALGRAAKNPWLRRRDAQEGVPPLAERAATLARDLAKASETVDEESDVIGNIRTLADSLRAHLDAEAPKYIAALPDQLSKLAAHEEHDPNEAAISILMDRRPRFLLFGPEERDLRSSYDLSEEAAAPPIALGNLARLADLDLVATRDAIQRGDYPRSEELLEAANNRLEEIFSESWRQSGVWLRLSLDEAVLRIFVTRGPGTFTSVAERSDGLLWFIALLTYTALHQGDVPPVLLVDEAETHLHYDAQADLVRVFTKQQQAAKVIYSTHSAGCLPHDLGSGVRVVVPDEHSGRSRLENNFWSEEGVGFSPLLIRMGATVLAFTPTRRAVIAEGGSEVVLLPSLLREAAKVDSLGFQVAPGGAEVSAAAAKDLDLEAAKVAFVVDSDDGGKGIKRKLQRGGIPSTRIIMLGRSTAKLSLEDFIREKAYLAAVNEELRRSHGDSHQMPAGSLPKRDRPGAVRNWCRQRGIEPPAKVNVAYRVLEAQAAGNSIVERGRRTTLESAYERIRKALDIDV